MNFLKRQVRNLSLFGIDLLKMKRSLEGLMPYYRDKRSLKRQLEGDTKFAWGDAYPVLADRTDNAGIMKGHYFHQDLFVAQKVFDADPIRHIDIGSRIDGFVAHVASFREIEIFDIRPVVSTIDRIVFRQADLMTIDTSLVGCCDSLSSLHAIEHFGLGRYGDPIDKLGHEKAISNLMEMLKTGGIMYFATPIGPQRIEFNAHRVFSVSYLVSLFETKMKIISLSYVDDKGELHREVDFSQREIEESFSCNYGCGIFELQKM
jgi:hypothetical protein